MFVENISLFTVLALVYGIDTNIFLKIKINILVRKHENKL